MEEALLEEHEGFKTEEEVVAEMWDANHIYDVSVSLRSTAGVSLSDSWLFVLLRLYSSEAWKAILES